MEQLTVQITVKVTEDDFKLLKARAAEEKRSMAWIARENIRKGLTAKN